MPNRFPRRTDVVLFVAAGLVAALVTIVPLAGSLRQVGRTFPGFVVWDNLVVVALGRPEWTGMRADTPFRSIVTAVDGRPVADRAGLEAIVGAVPPRTAHTYTFTTRTGVERRTVASMRFGRGDWVATMGVYAWNGIVFLLTGLVVFYLKPDSPQSRAVLAFGFVWGTTLLLAIDLFTTGRFDRIYFIFEAMTPAAGLHVALRFPETRLRGRGWLAAIYLPALAVGVVQSWAFAHATPLLLRVNDGVYLAIGAVCLAALATVAWGAFGQGTPIVRRRARVVLAGWVVAFVVPLVPMLAFFLFGRPVSFSLLALTGFVYPVSLGYAVARHDLFEADRFVKLSVVYAALTVFVSLTYATIVLMADRLALGFAVHDNPIFPVAFVLVMLATITPLRDRVQAAVDRLFYRGRVDYKTIVARVSERLADLFEPAPIVGLVTATLRDVLGIDHVAVWERRGPEFRRRDSNGRDVLVVDAPDVVAFAGVGRLLSRDEVEESPRLRAQRPALRALFERLEAVLVVPLGREGQLAGVVALGPKVSGRPLSSDDLDVVRTLANETAAALHTAQSVAQLEAARAQLQQAEHLAAIGELSAAVAHGIRNPLAGIRIAAQLGLEQVGENGGVRESLADVLGAVDRLEAQVRGILDFARPFEPRLEVVEPRGLLGDFTAEIAAQCAESRVVIDLRVPPGTRPVRVDPTHVRQVLHELVRNAFEAMPQGGRLVLGARNVDGEAPRVRVTVEDSGSGVPAAQHERIFRLFATTKSGGTGVGLAVARKIVERHGGTLTLETTAPDPARFVIELPAV
jgi:signal transduction histidine kinase